MASTSTTKTSSKTTKTTSKTASKTTFTPPPLTTFFEPSSSCTTDLSLVEYSSKAFFHLGPFSDRASKCFPSGWISSTNFYFSPGVCPNGYTEACRYTGNRGFTATCCPSGYSCMTRLDETATYPWFALDHCESAFARSRTFRYTYLDGDATVIRTTYDTAGLNHFGVVVRYASSDMSILPSSTSTESSGASSTPSDPLALPTETSEGGGGLSKGARIGIGVGIGLLALLLLAALGAFILYRRKKARQQQHQQLASDDRSGDGKEVGSSSSYPQQQHPAELHSDGTKVYYQPVELHGYDRVELQGSQVPELGDGRTAGTSPSTKRIIVEAP